VNRRRLSAGLGVAGAGLGLVAGVVQATVGSRIPEWTGAKAAPVPLGLLTVALSVLAAFAAVGQLRPGLALRARAGYALGLAVPGLLCLTTVGRLWYLPAVLLGTAAALCVDRWPATAAALVRDRYRVLLSALGGCELLMAAGATPWGMAVGGVGGLALIAAAWAFRTSGGVTAALVVGTLPFALVGWTVVVPILVAVVAVVLAVPILRAA
jgi:hypothetical protein